MADGIARFKDFTNMLGPISFQVGSHTFYAHGDVGFDTLGRLVALGEEVDGEGTSEEQSATYRKKTVDMFREVLTPESFTEFETLLNTPGDIRIGLGWIKHVFPWLIEQYGLRPTEASPSSSTSSSESGASSTDGAPSVASTPAVSKRVGV